MSLVQSILRDKTSKYSHTYDVFQSLFSQGDKYYGDKSGSSVLGLSETDKQGLLKKYVPK
jgi:hypothetical protein